MVGKHRKIATFVDPIDWNPPSHDEEAANIEAAAEHYRDKTGYDEPSEGPPPWRWAFQRLAYLQKQFKQIEYPPFDWNDPETSLAPPKARPIAVKAYKILRDLGIDRYGAKSILDAVGGRYADYRISIEERGDKVIHEVTRHVRVEMRTSLKRERVGVAIMLLRKGGLGIVEAQHKIEGCRMIDFIPEAIDETERGICFGAFEDTKKQWAAWKKEAFSRGFADPRAYGAEIDRRPWPKDQFWLSEV